MYGKCSKILYTFPFLFSNKVLFIRAGIQKILVRIANREDPGHLKKQSDLSMSYLSRLFCRQLVFEVVFEILEHLLYYKR